MSTFFALWKMILASTEFSGSSGYTTGFLHDLKPRNMEQTKFNKSREISWNPNVFFLTRDSHVSEENMSPWSKDRISALFQLSLAQNLGPLWPSKYRMSSFVALPNIGKWQGCAKDPGKKWSKFAVYHAPQDGCWYWCHGWTSKYGRR